MPKKRRKFADDGWAIWVDGDDTSTVYINDWLNPNGKNYVDLAVRICGIKGSKALFVYVPFALSKEEITDVSLSFHNKKILQATFSAACIVDYMKNEHTSELAYNGKTIDVVHISTIDYALKQLSTGTLISINLEKLHPFLANDEGYFIWRMPHKSLDELFKIRAHEENKKNRLRDLISTPVVAEKYGYSIRINESRLLPEEITRIGAFHRQKLRKSVITISIDESYELNDSGCHSIRRLEEDLYKEYLPKDYRCEDIITYMWKQTREHSLKGQFNYYYGISKNSVSRGSLSLYIVVLLLVGVVGNLMASGVLSLFSLFI